MSAKAGEVQSLKLGYTPSVRTNINLKRLLHAHFDLELEDVYATNLFPYVKPGAMNAHIPSKDLIRAAKQFTLPLIKILCPKISICLGKETFNALRRACGLRNVTNIEKAIHSTFSYNNSKIFCQAHTGQLGQNNRNRGGVNRVEGDWHSMYVEFASVV